MNPIGLKVSQRKLQRLIPIYEEHAVDQDLLVEGAHNLRDYLQSQGYFDAQVEFKQQSVINDKANLDFLIATGKRHKLVAITIDGNHYFDDRNDPRSACFCSPPTSCSFAHGRYSGRPAAARREHDS